MAPSTFGWVDFAAGDREKMAEVIKLFSEPDSRDELGLGTVRDALSNLLFPGTSTLQTRARYFLFIPWVYLSHERRRTSSKEIALKARGDEVKLIRLLKESGEKHGVIGMDAGESLERLPSAVYWSGLSVWGIRHHPGSQESYHRHFDRLEYRARVGNGSEEGDPMGPGHVSSWDPQLPDAPEDFLKQATFSLRQEEARYLQQRLMNLRPHSLLAHLVSQTRPQEKLDFIWNHPEAEGFPPRLRAQVEHARTFSELMHGAALLYNAMIAQLLPHREDLATDYEQGFSDWARLIGARQELRTWSREAFWTLIHDTGAQVSLASRRFIDGWIDRALEGSTPANLMSDAGAREQIRRRELELKGAQRARLSNTRARERWTGASGDRALDYRWFRARQLTADILHGVET